MDPVRREDESDTGDSGNLQRCQSANISTFAICTYPLLLRTYFHCWDPTVFLGEKRIKNGDILVFVVDIEKSYRTMCHFSSYTIKTKIDPFSMHFSS